MVELCPDDWVISPAPHLGDTYFTCSLAEAFLERHGGNRVQVVVPRRLWSVLRIFPGARITPLDPAEVTAPFRETRGFSLQQPFYLRPVKHWNYFQPKYLGRTLPFTMMYHDLLDLPFPSFAPPRVPEEVRYNAERRMRELDLPPGRTVILVPVSKSLTPFHGWFWEDLASAFAAQGYTVATNVTADQIDRCVFGTRPLDCPGDELIPIAELAGMVVASRCGICDVLSTAQTDMRILYQSSYLEWKPMAGVTMEWDLGPCGLKDHATYYRLGIREPHTDFIERIVAGRS